MTVLPKWIAFLFVAIISLAKGLGDATWGDPGWHPGTKYDLWHIVTRYAYFYPALIGWIIPQEEYRSKRGLAIALVVTAILSFVMFRIGVFFAGKYGAWYGG